MRRNLSLSLLLAALAAGCAADSTKQPTAKEQAVQQWNATRAAVLLSLAKDQYATGNFDRCRQTVDQAERMDDKNPATRILSAKLYIEQGNLDSAQQELAAAGKLDAKLAEPDYLEGVIDQRWQQPEKALECYGHACEKAPTEQAYLMAKAETMVDLGRQTEALALLQSKVVYFEHSAAVRDAVGLLLLQQHRPDDAVEMFRRATILAPDDSTLREHLANGLFQSGQYAEATEVLRALLDEKEYAKRTDLRLTLADSEMAVRRFVAARQDAQTACDDDPTSTIALLTLAKAHFALGEIQGTQIELHRALDLDPNCAEAYLLMGYLNLRQNSPQAALRNFSQAHDLDPADTTSMCMMGSALEKMNRSQEAIGWYEQALKLDPKDELADKLLTEASAR
jgi:tetratricopeptide (TPR) repeat protein